MAAVVEEKKQRAPFVKTKGYYEKIDENANKTFSIGSFIEVHRGRGWSYCQVISACRRGKLEVKNMITGKQYWASVDCLRAIGAPVRANPDATQPAQESRSRPSIVSLFLQPISKLDGRSEEERERRARLKMLPLSSDELIAYTSLSAICKTLNNLHLNADSFRNPKLFELLKTSHSCLTECLREMESYRELPEDA
jgi:hypothetical protein